MARAQLVYLHSILGRQWDPFVDVLARTHTVYAPYLPGTVPGDPDAHKAIEDVWDWPPMLDGLYAGADFSRWLHWSPKVRRTSAIRRRETGISWCPGPSRTSQKQPLKLGAISFTR